MHFRWLTLPLLSVLSMRFPQLFWLGASSFSPKPKLWHLQPLISLLRPLHWTPWQVTSSSSSTRLLRPPWKRAPHLTLLAPCSLTSQKPAWPLVGGIPLHLGFVLILLASRFPLPCPQLSSRRVSLMSKLLKFRLRPALLVLIPMVWMSLHILWGVANINATVVPMGAPGLSWEVFLLASCLQLSFFWFDGRLLAYL
jgi:hypothetical protein